MDNERKIKFLYPPLVLLGSLALGLCFDPCPPKKLDLNLLNIKEIENLIGIIIGAGLLILVSGYIIGTITISILRIFAVCNHRIYEVSKKQDFKQIQEIILKNTSDKIEGMEKLYAFATFDHLFLPPKIHDWVQRRWSSFNTSANTVTALTLSIIIGCILGISICTLWPLIIIFLTGIYAYHAYRSRKETIEMIGFQTKVKSPVKNQDKEEPKGNQPK